MKQLKNILTVLFLFTSVFVYADSYKIEGYDLHINGMTGEKIFRSKFTVDTNKSFSSEEDLNKYISNFKQSILNERQFEDIEVNSSVSSESVNETSGEKTTYIRLDICFRDSFHFLAMPYPSYSTSDGFKLKIKAKDSNFLGSLNSMSANLNYTMDTNETSLGFSYDYPFTLGIFDTQLINDYSISYTPGNPYLEWELYAGIKMNYKINSFMSTYYIFKQGFINDFDYSKYDDNQYFKEYFETGLPLSFCNFSNNTSLSYSPSFSVTYLWDKNGINKDNDSFATPVLTFSHSLSNSKINWNNNFRNGYSLSISNSNNYVFQRNDFYYSLKFNGQAFINYNLHPEQDYFERYGINLNYYAFWYPDVPGNKNKYGEKIGPDLRGIVDKNISEQSAAMVFNLELPHHIASTNFSKDIFNFDLIVQPTFDMALLKSKDGKKDFSFADGLYCGGLEILVFPKKWSSYTIRASLGFDIKEALNEPNFLLGIFNHKEIFIGLGIQF